MRKGAFQAGDVDERYLVHGLDGVCCMFSVNLDDSYLSVCSLENSEPGSTAYIRMTDLTWRS